jgi:hypothetical protein
VVSPVPVVPHGLDLLAHEIQCHLENVFVLNLRPLINKIKTVF